MRILGGDKKLYVLSSWKWLLVAEVGGTGERTVPSGSKINSLHKQIIAENSRWKTLLHCFLWVYLTSTESLEM